MIKPTSAYYDRARKTSMLQFEDQDPIECSMRGGICWPISYIDTATGITDIVGHAIMAGKDVKTGIIYVFEQIEWITIDTILKPDNSVRYLGLSAWFNRIWTQYFGGKFYFLQNHELSKQYRLQVYRSEMINPKPRFHELPPVDNHDMISTIWRTIKEGQLRYEKGCKLAEQLKTLRAGEKQMMPAVHALACCLTGFERYRWKESFVRPEIEILVK